MPAYLLVSDFALQLRPRRQGRHRVDHHQVQGTRQAQPARDLGTRWRPACQQQAHQGTGTRLVGPITSSAFSPHSGWEMTASSTLTPHFRA